MFEDLQSIRNVLQFIGHLLLPNNINISYVWFVSAIEMEVIDSCATNNGGCDHDCKHGVGGPICSCHKGYMLQADGRTCEGEFRNLSPSHMVLSTFHYCITVTFYHSSHCLTYLFV